jgi:hypothetical protein
VSERGKISFSELDRRRREKKRGGGRPKRSSRRSRAASAAYKRKVEERLFGKRGDQGRTRLEERMRAAHGTPNFLRAYREYSRSFGMPEEFPTLMLLLDLDDDREVVHVVEALRAVVKNAPLDQRNLLRSRLRNLEMSASSDEVADAAADLLGQL